VDAEGVSRPNDSIKNQTQNHSLVTSLDTPGADTYFCLTAEQENVELLHNQKQDPVQTIGG
jgi:hypothetical protein